MIELIKRLAADHTNTQIAEQLDAAGMRTSTGLPFDEKAIRWLRWRYRIGTQPAARRGTDRHPGRRALRHLRRHRLRVDLNRQARRPPRARQPALHPIRSRRRAALPTSWSPAPFTYPPKPKSGLQEVQFDATVPTVRDRVVQAAAKIVIEPIFEADLCSVLVRVPPRTLGARRAPGLVDESWRGSAMGRGVGRR